MKTDFWPEFLLVDTSVTFEENLRRFIKENEGHPLREAFDFACKAYEEDDALQLVMDELRVGLTRKLSFEEIKAEVISSCEEVIRNIVVNRLRGRK